MSKRGAQAGAMNPAYTHGHTTGGFSPTYHSWSSMWTRCTNKNRRSYKYYGGKGVAVCERWKSFELFLEDMGERPSGLTLERVDVHGNYEPGNCIWADSVTQARNSVQVVWVEIRGERKRLVEWCEHYGRSINTVRSRVKRYGWDYVSAIVTPPLH